MSNDDSMPPQPKTAELPAADPVQVLLLKIQRGMDTGFLNMGADIKLVANDLSVVKERVNLLERRADNTSDRVKQASSSDLDHDAQLAQERLAREELAAKVDALTTTQATQLAILGRLDKVAANPHVKVILAVLAAAAVSWATSKGLK